jgi:hypothetical protein
VRKEDDLISEIRRSDFYQILILAKIKKGFENTKFDPKMLLY